MRGPSSRSGCGSSARQTSAFRTKQASGSVWSPRSSSKRETRSHRVSSHPSPSPPPRLYPLGTGAPTLAPTPTSTGFADYTTAEAGYQIKGPVGGDKGTARGPVSLVNWACPKHVNTRYGQHPQSGGFSAVATRRIQVGESIYTGYSADVRMVCLGCDPHAFRTRTSQRVATSATSGAVR